MCIRDRIILERKEKVLSIPESTVEFSGDSTFVQILQDSLSRPQKFKRSPVTLGLSDGIKIEVKSGLKSGENIRGNKIIER